MTRKWRRGLVSGLLGLVVALGARYLGLTQLSDLKLQDAFQRIRGEEPASDRIALVEIDDETLRAYRRWPLPRDQYALLIDAAMEGGAFAIGFDILFAGEDSSDSELLLAEQSAANPVVHAIAFHETAETNADTPAP